MTYRLHADDDSLHDLLCCSTGTDFLEACRDMIDLLQSSTAVPGPEFGREGETLWEELVLLNRDHARKMAARAVEVRFF